MMNYICIYCIALVPSLTTFLCCEKTPWPSQIIEEFIGSYSFRELESMTIMAKSMVAGREAWSCSVFESLYLIHNHETERAN